MREMTKQMTKEEKRKEILKRDKERLLEARKIMTPFDFMTYLFKVGAEQERELKELDKEYEKLENVTK